MRYIIIHKDLKVKEQFEPLTTEQHSQLENKEIRILELRTKRGIFPKQVDSDSYLYEEVQLYEIDSTGRSWIFYDIEERDRQLELEQQRS